MAPLGAAAVIASRIEGAHYPIFWQRRQVNGTDEIRMPKVKTLAGEITNTVSPTGYRHDRVAGPAMALARKLHIDETLQLALVWGPGLDEGKMSVVGPRPIVPDEYEAIMDVLSPTEQQEWEAARTVCKPGLMNSMSIAQHKPGYQNDPRVTAGADIEYAAKASLGHDLAIIAATARAIGGSMVRVSSTSRQ
jgi:lipopolysaccharide/colanic/teichoic acid biosynthesis glycosyltransferase